VYGQVSAAGAAAGVPAVLAVTGVSGTGFAIMSGLAALLVIAGVTLLRLAYRAG
jgi:hypothetical protein